MGRQCKAVGVDDKDRVWNFCPNIGAAYLFTILFALTTCVHLVQAVIFRKGYCWVITVAGFAQTICYILRILSIQHPASIEFYSGWFILILVSPLLTNAFVYMVMGRMVYNFTTSAKLFGIKAWRFTLYFVLLDIFAFLVQVGGASIASGNNKSDHTILLGLHVYMGGVGFQQLFILLFVYIAFRFQQEVTRERSSKTSRALLLLYIEYAVLALITVRIIFRLIEYSSGLDSTIPNHEAYQYIFDSLPMFIALVLFNVIHPGKIMPGKESDFPSRKERKTFFKMDSGDDDTAILPRTEGARDVEMPLETNYRPRINPEPPKYGYIQ